MKQNNCKIIGITGGIATGKSTVSNILLKRGYPLIDADKVAREVAEIGKPAYFKIIQEFGQGILNEDKSLNRKMLGKIIFSDEEARKKLNNITHPYIFESIKEKLELLSKGNPVVFLDIPLLFEEYYSLIQHGINFDEIWLVYADKEIQVDRLMKRDNISKDEAVKKIQSQMDMEEKKKMATRIIDNSGDIKSLEEQIDIILESI